MQILKFPNPLLFKPCAKVTVFNEELRTFLDSMWATMQENNGIGLAANQVGLSEHMFVMHGPNQRRVNLVNPCITARSRAPASLKEGCLSAPGEVIMVPDRVDWVQVTYEDEYGESHVSVFKGIHSVCVQHEIEHLEGKGFMENKTISKTKRKELAKKWGLK